ncbi:hypothetical protein [Kiloniella laminariae]|uniref:hypothetical protein n=1 Tax=Kiloniella laminariae TaxID=454162 RepID=UPI000380960D|nr:hypothetical protein [Kiloniella laminariae]
MGIAQDFGGVMGYFSLIKLIAYCLWTGRNVFLQRKFEFIPGGKHPGTWFYAAVPPALCYLALFLLTAIGITDFPFFYDFIAYFEKTIPVAQHVIHYKSAYNFLFSVVLVSYSIAFLFFPRDLYILWKRKNHLKIDRKVLWLILNIIQARSWIGVTKFIIATPLIFLFMGYTVFILLYDTNPLDCDLSSGSAFGNYLMGTGVCSSGFVLICLMYLPVCIFGFLSLGLPTYLFCITELFSADMPLRNKEGLIGRSNKSGIK